MIATPAPPPDYTDRLSPIKLQARLVESLSPFGCVPDKSAYRDIRALRELAVIANRPIPLPARRARNHCSRANAIICGS
jgi:hypothetical protein